MKKNLTLYQKGLLFIGSPILVLLGLLIFLYVLFGQIESLEKAEHHSKNVIGQTNWFSYLVSLASASSLGYVITGDKEWSDLYDSAKNQMAKGGPAFSEEVGDNPDQKQRVDGGVAVVQKMLQIYDRCTKTPGNSKELIASKGEIYQCTDLLIDLRHDILRTDLESFKQPPEMITSQRKLFRFFIVVAAVLSAVIGFFLFFVYNKGITNRLAILSENTAKFSKREALHELLPGHDEVAQLDVSFHDMANRLLLAEQQKQQFLSMISHDLRTPIAAVSGTVELISDGIVDPRSEQGAALMTKTQKSIQTVLNLINELLEIEKIESKMLVLEYGDTTVSEIVNTAIDLVISIADQKHVTIGAPTTDVYVHADRDRLVRVIVNLLGNALKFAPDGSAIEIDLEQQQDLWKLKISDNGPGIPPEFVGSIFDRFKQVRSDQGGSGLGLAICKAIVEEHGGKIGVKSVVGKGSTFWFEIPFRKPNDGGNR